MRTSSKFILAALASTAALAGAMPAQAQQYPSTNQRWDDRDERRWDDRDDRRWDNRDERRWDDRGQANALNRQIAQLEQQVRRFDSRDRISEREANALRRQVYSLRQQFNAYARNGLSQREFYTLQNGIQNVRQRLNYERRDRDGRRW